MNNTYYDFQNTGYKIHIPCVDVTDDPLTRRIADFLDEKYGLETNNARQYDTGYYKVGSGGETRDGKGITLYGRTGSMTEMKELAKEIEDKFGPELSECIKKNNITSDDPLMLTENVSVRFAVYNHGVKNPGDKFITEPLWTYPWEHNKSGAIPTHTYKKIDGTIATGNCLNLKKMPEIDQKFWHGDSTMYAIDNFGELFTGKIENGKVPQFIMDGLPKEYLEHYNISEKEIVERINNGTKKIVANMLEDVVKKPNSRILKGNPPWFATLDIKVINEAKELLAQNEPETVQKLEQMLPQLENACPALSVLRKTTPYSKMQIIMSEQNPVNPTGDTQPLTNRDKLKPEGTQKPDIHTPKPQPTPKPTNIGESAAKSGLFEKLGTKGKIGLAIVGTTLIAGTLYALSRNKYKKTEMTQVQTNKQTMPAQKMLYNSYSRYNNPLSV